MIGRGVGGLVGAGVSIGFGLRAALWAQVAAYSSSSPLWAGIAADMDSYARGRVGFLNPLLYQLSRTSPGTYLNDITGAGQTIKTDGLYPTTPGYDGATGLGSPKLAALITAARS